MSRFLTASIALTLLGTGAAHARTAEVRYADLNLAHPAGQAELDRRVESAARKVCAFTLPPTTRIENHREVDRCKADVRAQVSAALKA